MYMITLICEIPLFYKITTKLFNRLTSILVNELNRLKIHILMIILLP